MMLILMFAMLMAAQEDQTPRPPQKNNRGLLQVNRDYYDLAAATGGDFYFWAPGEFAASNLQIPIEHDEVLLSYDTLQTKRVFEIPVESGVRSLEIFAGVQRKDLAVLVKPDGTVFREPVQSFQHMLIARINAPSPGLWRLELHGAGLFCVTAHVQPADHGPELVKVLLKKETCEIEFAGNASKLQVELVAKDGSPLAQAPMQKIEEERYVARCAAPEVPFRVSITGLDANGNAFRRVERGLRQ